MSSFLFKPIFLVKTIVYCQVAKPRQMQKQLFQTLPIQKWHQMRLAPILFSIFLSITDNMYICMYKNSNLFNLGPGATRKLWWGCP